MGKPEQLDVERRARIDDGVAVETLRVKVALALEVHEMVINHRIDADQRRNGPGNRRYAYHPAKRDSGS